MNLHPPVSRADYVGAMAPHVASVCIVATVCDGVRYGLTATAVASVSAEPPRLLVCVNKSSFTHDRIVAAGHFSVSLLAEDQVPLAELFAGLSGDKTDCFAAAGWTVLTTGAPILIGAAAAFDCRLAQALEQPTHTIFIGDVVGVANPTGRDSLVYGARRFRKLAQSDAR